jgi:excisionase family DNA binding protein
MRDSAKRSAFKDTTRVLRPLNASVVCFNFRITGGNAMPAKAKTKDKSQEEIMTVTQYAEKRGVSTQYIRRLIAEGKIKAIKVNERLWLIKEQ